MQIAVAFLHADNITRGIAQIMVASVRPNMPGAMVVRITDSGAEPISGVSRG